MTVVDRVVVVVFDGLRPDMIAERMPALKDFADRNLWFREARSVFPSMTRVATTATATGDWPGRNGIVNNAFHQPQVVAGTPLDTSNFKHLAQLKAAQDSVVTTTSLGQALAANGLKMGAVHCGSAGSAYLINHDVVANGHWTVSAFGPDFTQTPEIMAQAETQVGRLPEMDIPKFGAIDYGVRVFLEMALATDGPDLCLLWLPEPDTTYHYRGIGSDEATKVMGAADQAFARVLEAVEADTRKTAVLAMSDHGQISTTAEVDITAAMERDGLLAHHRPTEAHKLGLTRGSMGEVRSLDGDMGLISAACDWLMSRDDIGMVFARDDLSDGLEGTLPMSAVHHGHRRDPELFFTMASSDAPDRYGLPGHCLMIAGVPVGGGMHGGLNRYELNTTMIWQVPGGRIGLDDSPVGLVDIAPSICALLGVPFDAQGRVLPLITPETGSAQAEVLETGRGAFRQRLERRIIDGRAYLWQGGQIGLDQ